MYWPSLLSLAAMATAPFAAGFATAAAAAEPIRVLEPVAHENLAVYFVHGPSAPGPVPLSLQEALLNGSVTVYETGNVNTLEIENSGTEDVFVQAGDIVKGGRQDRVLTVSLLVPARSGRLPIGAYCVEHGRWSARGREDAYRFSSAEKAVPSREAKLAMLAPGQSRQPTAAAPPAGASRESTLRNVEQRQLVGRGGSNTESRQSEVWAQVAKIQQTLSASVNARVASEVSASSLQLSLENEKVAQARSRYVDALKGAGEADESIVGVVVAINGRISSADVYPSNGLFRKMWPKILDAAATEALGVKAEKPAPAPAAQAARAFMSAAEAARAAPAPSGADGHAQLAVREASDALLVESRRKDGALIHRTYVAK
jgi:hypothetical protein